MQDDTRAFGGKRRSTGWWPRHQGPWRCRHRPADFDLYCIAFLAGGGPGGAAGNIARLSVTTLSVSESGTFVSPTIGAAMLLGWQRAARAQSQ